MPRPDGRMNGRADEWAGPPRGQSPRPHGGTQTKKNNKRKIKTAEKSRSRTRRSGKRMRRSGFRRRRFAERSHLSVGRCFIARDAVGRRGDADGERPASRPLSTPNIRVAVNRWPSTADVRPINATASLGSVLGSVDVIRWHRPIRRRRRRRPKDRAGNAGPSRGWGR